MHFLVTFNDFMNQEMIGTERTFTVC